MTTALSAAENLGPDEWWTITQSVSATDMLVLLRVSRGLRRARHVGAVRLVIDHPLRSLGTDGEGGAAGFGLVTNFHALHCLSLSENALQASGLAVLAQRVHLMPRLERLDVSHNGSSHDEVGACTHPARLEAFAALLRALHSTNLRVLDLACCGFMDSIATTAAADLLRGGPLQRLR